MVRLLLALCLAAGLHAADFDLVIRNARVIDGAGNPWFRADVGIKDGKIAAVGRLGRATAAREIDARDRVVAPGFIDITLTSRAPSKKSPAATTTSWTASPPW